MRLASVRGRQGEDLPGDADPKSAAGGSLEVGTAETQRNGKAGRSRSRPTNHHPTATGDQLESQLGLVHLHSTTSAVFFFTAGSPRGSEPPLLPVCLFYRRSLACRHHSVVRLLHLPISGGSWP